MVVDAEARRDELMQQSRDPNWLTSSTTRASPASAGFLRRTSLDELPQLFNVLRGEMSLVGPRPLPEARGRSGRRLGPRPPRPDARASPASGRCSAGPRIPFDEMVKLDYIYVTNWSLWLDVRSCCRTLPAVFGRRGAN